MWHGHVLRIGRHARSKQRACHPTLSRTRNECGLRYDSMLPEGNQGQFVADRLRAAVMLFLFVEALLAIIGVLLRPNIIRDVWWLLAMVLSFSLVYCITHVQVRFRAPVEPIMAMIVAVLLTDAYHAWRSHRARFAVNSIRHRRSDRPET